MIQPLHLHAENNNVQTTPPRHVDWLESGAWFLNKNKIKDDDAHKSADGTKKRRRKEESSILLYVGLCIRNIWQDNFLRSPFFPILCSCYLLNRAPYTASRDEGGNNGTKRNQCKNTDKRSLYSFRYVLSRSDYFTVSFGDTHAHAISRLTKG